MEGETVRAELAEKFPHWRIWRNGTVAYAWWQRTTPPIRLSDSSFAGLEKRIPLAEEAWERTHSYWATLEAAGQEDT